MSAELKIKISGDGSGFATALIKAKQQASSFNSSLAAGLKEHATGLVGAAALTALAHKTTEYGGRINDLSSRLGVSTDALQEFDYAMQLNGGTLDDAVGSLQKLSVARQAALDNPHGEQSNAFAALNVSVEQLKHARLEDIFRQIGVAFKSAEDPQRLLADAIAVMGRGAPAVFAAMRDGLEEAGASARKLGIIIDAEVIAKLDELGDRSTTMGKRMVAGMAPVLVVFAEVAARIMDLLALVANVAALPARVAGAIAGGASPAEALRQAMREGAAEAESIISAYEDRQRNRPGRGTMPELNMEGREGADSARLREAARLAHIEEEIAEIIRRRQLDGMTAAERRAALLDQVRRAENAAAQFQEDRELGTLTATQAISEAEARRELEKRRSELQNADQALAKAGTKVPDRATDRLTQIGMDVSKVPISQVRDDAATRFYAQQREAAQKQLSATEESIRLQRELLGMI